MGGRGGRGGGGGERKEREGRSAGCDMSIIIIITYHLKHLIHDTLHSLARF